MVHFNTTIDLYAIEPSWHCCNVSRFLLVCCPG